MDDKPAEDLEQQAQDASVLEPILKAFSWTKFSPYKEELFHRKISDSIGNNYTPQAADLNLEVLDSVLHRTRHASVTNCQPNSVPESPKLRQKSSAYALENAPGQWGSPPQTPESRRRAIANQASYFDQEFNAVEPADQFDNLSSHLNAKWTPASRFVHYVNSVARDKLPQLDSVVDLGRMLSKAKISLSRGGEALSDVSKEPTHALLEDLNTWFQNACAQSVVEYVLLAPEEQERLKIPGFRRYSYEPKVCRAPVPWHESFAKHKAELERSLCTVNEMMGEVQALSLAVFPKFVQQARLVFENPSSNFPVTLDTFKELFRALFTELAIEITNSWLTPIAKIFSERKSVWYKDGNNAEELDHFFESVSVLMANCLNQHLLLPLVHTMEQGISRIAKLSFPPIFILEAAITSGSLITLSPDPVDIEFGLYTVLTELVAIFEGIPRVETLLFTSLYNHPALKLKCLTLDDEQINHGLKLKSSIQSYANGPQTCLKRFDHFQALLSGKTLKRINDFIRQQKKFLPLDQVEKERTMLAQMLADLMSLEASIDLPVYRLDCHQVQQELNQRAEKCMNLLIEHICQQHREHCLQLCEQYEKISVRGMQLPQTVPDLVSLLTFLEEAQNKTLPQLGSELAQSQPMLEFILNNALISEEDMKLNNVVFTWPSRMEPILELAEKRLASKKLKAGEALRSLVQTTHEQTEEQLALIQKFQDYGLLNELPDHLKRISNIEEALAVISKQIEQVHSEETLLGLENTPFAKFDACIENFAPYQQLWKTASDLQTCLSVWLNGPFLQLDAPVVEEQVQKMWRQLFKLTKTFHSQPVPRKLAESLKGRLEKFKLHLPLISVLRNPGLKQRHWAQMEKIGGLTEKSLSPNEESTFAKILELNLSAMLPQFETVSEAASKEASLEKSLLKMQQEWQPLAVTCVLYRETGTFVLGGLDDIQPLLEDHIVKTQTMSSSPFVQPIAAEMTRWETALKRLQELLDVWLQVQASWLYLEPVFSSEDILTQMPLEGKKFRQVDRTWRDVMASTAADPSLLQLADQKALLTKLKDSAKLLDEIQKGLADYLEKKRLAFPRFFFLSNDELLEILSETKDPTRVQPHLKKCFEGINSLTFQENARIIAMCSSEGERVRFKDAVEPSQAKGAVEKWLLQVEKSMQSSVHDQMLKAVKAYMETPREKWVLEWPGQVVLAVSHVFWTLGVEQALQRSSGDSGAGTSSLGQATSVGLTSGVGSLKSYRDTLMQQLNELIHLVRGELLPMSRLTLGALVVMDVHSRDVVEQLLESRVSMLEDFEWQSQLRYYWNDNQLVVKMIHAMLPYGYEYLGNSPRLVMTPLTDRCYRTLIGALDLYLGGAPEGPAGTGKTETTKDLAKALAKQCVVFNCSDGLDYLAMGKFFKGVASSGAWACFDEFNRIDLEVLSVVAQQILTIQRAVAGKATSFVFEGTTLNLNRECAVFITMNPGYAGRSELPDNLKSLFRPVAMMVPDYTLIAEISLYSFGFIEARALAVKITATYKLCSEQLSSQDHYDYGMRAVKSVLSAAGALKLRFPGENEHVLVLQSISDVNTPKFLAQDIPLFQGILADLFPNVQLPNPDRKKLIHAMEQELGAANLQVVPYVIEKMIQIYEMMHIRHGFMLVGEPFSAKTTCLKILAKALGQPALGEKRVEMAFINPKAITMGQLYGQFDAVTHEWSDGVLARIFRQFASVANERRWIVLDGPVDAIWIENMNTVLDDNKKLCLTSGEMMQLSNSMSMIFEVRDLAVASPATVSRCGMIYMEPSSLGWQPIVKSWQTSSKMSSLLTTENRELLEMLISYFLEDSIEFVRKSSTFVSPMSLINLAVSFTKLFSSFLIKESAANPDVNSLVSESLAADRAIQPIVNAQLVVNAFIFCLIWSVGGAVDAASRAPFDAMLKEKINSCDLKQVQLSGVCKSCPPNATLFDVRYIFSANGDNSAAAQGTTVVGEWRLWDSLLGKCEIPAKAKLSEILVPNAETVKYDYLLDLLILGGHPGLLVGPSGTGKSAYINHKLKRGLNPATFSTLFVHLSAQTSANQVREWIISKLDKRRKGVYGAPLNKRAVLFIDDLSMPSAEKYGAQPPLELVRQYLDHGQWYDVSDTTEIYLTDVQCLAAMAAPVGGKIPMTARLARHFVTFGVPQFSTSTLYQIFHTILSWHLCTAYSFPSAIQNVASDLVEATCQLFDECTKQLLPTPLKSHYLFNSRDVARVVQGLLLSRPTPNFVASTTGMVNLWLHESMRVFHDRLTDDGDRQLVTALVQKAAAEFLETGSLRPANEIQSLVFFPTSNGTTASYEEKSDLNALQQLVQEKLVEYNQVSKSPMDLVIFQFAVMHLTRIARVLNLAGGHALLAGVGGSGRQSLTKLAAYLTGVELFQIELSATYGKQEWLDDLKRVLTLAGGAKGSPVVFLLSDAHLKHSFFLEDINNLLNIGQVPNLFAADEKAQLSEAMKPFAAGGASTSLDLAALWEVFLSRCRENLHVVLALSPVSDTFRTRLRQFPALVNCCTMDWFTPWPTEGLRVVAEKWLADIEWSSAEQRESVIQMCAKYHSTTQELSTKYRAVSKRHNYVTPTSFLDLLSTFKGMLREQQTKVKQQIERYEIGLDQIASASSQVGEMQKELTELQPKLIATSKETEEILVQVQSESVQVEKTKELVKADEAIATVKADEATAIKRECELELAEAIPALNAALEALDTLKPQDITLVKSMKNPPAAVKLVMEAICVMKNVKPVRIKDPAGSGKMVDDYWGPALKMLSDPHFLDSLKEYDKDNINPKIMERIRKQFIPNEDFVPAIIKNSSSAAEGLCKWVCALDKYDAVSKVVEPKRQALKKAEGELEEEMAKLNVKRAELAKVEARMAALNQKFQEMSGKKEDLQRQVTHCQQKLDRAEKLIGGLYGERDRWSKTAQNLRGVYDELCFNVLFASGVIAYLGAFTPTFRQEAFTLFASGKDSSVTLQGTLGDPIAIQGWVLAGLPNDSFSVENAIISTRTRRWPLFIDPQGQANRWIRNMEKDNNLQVIKLSDADFVRTLENAIQFGYPVLLENVKEELDPVLEPVLQKQVFKSNGLPCIKLGENVVEYSEKFKLYITTKLRNPHYLPELSTRVTLLNFMITPEGLADQLLGIVAAKERPELELERHKLLVQSQENEAQLKRIEDNILEILQRSQGNLLEDETGINALTKAKTLSTDIAHKQKIAAATEQEINKTRAGYAPIAAHTAALFFIVADLAVVDPMYQNSLSWFIQLFLNVIRDTEKSADLQQRLNGLKKNFTGALFTQICRSLFKKDKLLFSFLLSLGIMKNEGRITSHSMLNSLVGSNAVVADSSSTRTESVDWLPKKSVLELECISKAIPGLFGDIFDSLERDKVKWKEYYECKNPQTFEAVPTPANVNDSDSLAFYKLLLLKIVRPDKLVPGVAEFVKQTLGEKFVDPPGFDLLASFADSNASTPLIFILSPGSDPMGSLLRFAEQQKPPAQVQSVSLGQGQGAAAANLIKLGSRSGSWVVLQNCHLAASWLPTLEKICSDLVVENPNFRLWLTSYPSDAFPVALLQNGIKMTNEPPAGLRANILRSFTSDPIADIANFYSLMREDRKEEFDKLLFGLTFFHAVVQERRAFGPLGWNIPYEFNDSDLAISIRQLHKFLNESEDIPFKALSYLTGECNYGGRVTDDRDRRVLMNLLQRFYDPEILSNDYKLSSSGIYHAPAHGTMSEYLAYIKGLPSTTSPEIFGLHDNAEIAKDLSDTSSLLETLSTQSIVSASSATAAAVSTQPDKGKEVALTDEERVKELSETLIKQLPENFDIEAAAEKYPIVYTESLNTVLVQELVRFNKLLSYIRSTLKNANKAVQGLSIMSPDLELVVRALLTNKIPETWLTFSYPSLKSLSSYFADFLARLSFFSNWLLNGPPVVFPINNFFFTQSFLTGTLQNFARKYGIPIDLLQLGFTVLRDADSQKCLKPEDGVYVAGMHLEGARWDRIQWCLGEQYPKQLHDLLPIVHILPFSSSSAATKGHHQIGGQLFYDSPVYRTSSRRGTLSTTGHSTNYVMNVKLPTERPPSHWIDRGVACVLSLSD